MDNDNAEIAVVDRRTVKVRVTMTWEVDAEVEDTVGGRFRLSGWLAKPGDIFAACTFDNVKRTEIETLSGEPLTRENTDG